jgi:predicted regulator of Ras-like GTPase activity (Roadblock/LC7/MglB family)
MEGAEDPTRSDPLKQALAEYLLIPGVRAAILVSNQGLMISGATHDQVDTAGIAALVIDTVAAAQRFGHQLRAGQLDTMSIEFEKLTLILAPFTPDVMLAVAADPGSVGALNGIAVPDIDLASSGRPSGRSDRSKDQG